MPDTIAHYRVVAKLGEGGMGVVYAADDQRLRRRVALKMVRDTGADPQWRERLWREARAAASVSHPNICQLYEIGEAEGELFLAMELLEGEPLAARLTRGAIPQTESVQIALAVLSALEALHARGIVHRDLKPSNIFLTPHGVKLLDFGLASTAQDVSSETQRDITMAGTVMGTPHYMSPEQLTGDPAGRPVGSVCRRRDSLRAARRRHCVSGQDHGTGVSQCHVRTHCRSVGGSTALAAIDRIIQRATQKRPADRQPDAATMAHELRRTLDLGDSGALVTARRMTRLIVLPFRMLRPDPEIDFLSFSLADAITASLRGLESLVVRSSLAATGFKAETLDLATLASTLDIDTAVTGTLLRAGAKVRVATQLVEAPGGRLLWSQTTQVTLNDIFDLQDELTHRIVESLSLPLSSQDERLLARDAPANARAYECFLRGNELSSDPKSWPLARGLYEEAVQADPQYAPAWAALGRVRRLIGKLGGGKREDLAGAEDALRRALDLNPDLPLAHNLIAQVDIDRGRARDAMVRLLGQATRRRTDPDLFAGLVYACRYCGLLGPSLLAHQRARRLDPSIKTSVIHTLWALREHEAVLTAGGGATVVGFSLLALGREQEALAFLIENEKTVAARVGQMVGGLRRLLQGKRDEAIALLSLASIDFQDPEGLYYLGRQLARAGASEQAIDLLERAAAAGFWCYPVLATDEWLDPVRERPAFSAVLARAKHEHDLAVSAFAAAGGDRVLRG